MSSKSKITDEPIAPKGTARADKGETKTKTHVPSLDYFLKKVKEIGTDEQINTFENFANISTKYISKVHSAQRIVEAIQTHLKLYDDKGIVCKELKRLAMDLCIDNQATSLLLHFLSLSMESVYKNKKNKS